jgi:hypothetical protein
MNIHIASRMLQYGGSFAQAIADAWVVADPANRAKLEDTFSELFNKYRGDEIE